MLNDIPIRVNRKGVNASDMAFKIFPLQNKSKISHRRQKTYDNKQNQNDQKLIVQSKHLQTSKVEFRYRRASSSGAARKFPKDFFKNQNMVVPIRVKNNKPNTIQFESSQKIRTIQKTQTEQHKRILTENKSGNRNPTGLITVKQSALQDILETPKFNTKINQNNNHKNIKVKLKQYLSYKKQRMENKLQHDFQINFLQNQEDQKEPQINFLQTLNPIQQMKNKIKINKFLEDKIQKQKQNIIKKGAEKQSLQKKFNLIQKLSKFQYFEKDYNNKIIVKQEEKDETRDVSACFRIRKF